jgi:tetratricopeptide (TPR) repeat protein
MSRPLRAWAAAILALALAALPSSGARAQDDSDHLINELLPVIPGLGSDPLEIRAFWAFQQREYVRARSLTELALKANPESPGAHYILGLLLHRSDGSLPRALFHLEKSRALFEARFGRVAFDPAPWKWHQLAIDEAAQVNGAMGNDERKLELLAEVEELYGGLLSRQRGVQQEIRIAERGWPLMRLHRYGEARAAVEQALQLDGLRFPEQRVNALNALCAIEGEQQHRKETYLECLRSAELDRQEGFGDPVAFTNAAIGAQAMLKMDEAEQLMLEGTRHFARGVVSNPWLDLMVLYVAQGRTPEALGALREMHSWRNRQPPYMDEQNRAQTEVAAAQFLVVAGKPSEAANITRRSLEQPDRTGYTSSDTEQWQAASALIFTIASKTAAELKLEEVSWLPFWEGLNARAEAWSLRFQAWSAGRRAASLLAGQRILVSTVRPYLPGGVEIAEWVQLELPSLLGPGVLSAAVKQARAVETLDEAKGYFSAFETEIARLDGDERETLESATRALDELPVPEVLIQARVSAIGAEAAWELGERGRAEALFSRALQVDPGVLRRTGIRLPVRIVAGARPAEQQAARALARSPRLTDGGRFTLTVSSEGEALLACLSGSQGEVFGCARATPRAGDDDATLAARVAAEFHAELFAPRIDLTQADIRSLDGSPTAAGGRATEHLHTILDDLVGSDAP